MQNSKFILEFLKEVFHTKLLIMVTHDKLLAKKYSDRLIILNDGNILYDSSPWLLNDKSKLLISKCKMSFLDNSKYALISLKRKKIRNILTIIAIVISITTISLVMFLSEGFKYKIIEYKNGFFDTYPLVITKNSEVSIVKNKINRYDYKTDIKLDRNFVLSLEKFCKDNNLKYLKKYDKKVGVNSLENINFSSYINNYYLKKNYKLIKGTYPRKENQILLKISNHSMNGKLFDYFGLDSNSVNYDDLLSKKMIMEGTSTNLVIVGIVEPKSKFGFDELVDYDSDFLYRKDLDNRLTDKNEYAIYVYGNKNIIKNYLSDYPSVKYEDIARTLENYLSKTLNSIQEFFLLFSCISLFVSIILII